jgi:phosphoribosylformylglycinamidine synthase
MITAKVYVTLKRAVLDPQGQAVQRALKRLGFDEVVGARIGKYVELQLEGERAAAEKRVREMCEKLLCNGIIEEYRVELGA